MERQMGYTPAEIMTELCRRLTDEALQFIIDRGPTDKRAPLELLLEYQKKHGKSALLSGTMLTPDTHGGTF